MQLPLGPAPHPHDRADASWEQLQQWRSATVNSGPGGMHQATFLVEETRSPSRSDESLAGRQHGAGVWTHKVGNGSLCDRGIRQRCRTNIKETIRSIIVFSLSGKHNAHQLTLSRNRHYASDLMISHWRTWYAEPPFSGFLRAGSPTERTSQRTRGIGQLGDCAALGDWVKRRHAAPAPASAAPASRVTCHRVTPHRIASSGNR